MNFELLALDVVILPPPDVAARAVAISASLPHEEFRGLRLDQSHLPHITLAQLFAREDELDRVHEQVNAVVANRAAMTLRVTGGARGGNTVWMGIESSQSLVDLHQRLMDALRDLEHVDGGEAAFFDHDARVEDVAWVAGYRLKSSFQSFTPHITLGHAAEPPKIEPFDFEASTIAVCHLGRFCTCRHTFRQWTLPPNRSIS